MKMIAIFAKSLARATQNVAAPVKITGAPTKNVGEPAKMMQNFAQNTRKRGFVRFAALRRVKR